MNDDELIDFEANGLMLPPGAVDEGFVENDGARIWFASYGSGPAVFLLHGGMGHGGNFGKQVPALVTAGYQAVAVHSRGHGHSTRDERPFSYDLMATDVLAVMDALGLAKAAMVGWSDGACTALIAAAKHPERVSGVFFFACNMDPSGTRPFEFTPMIGRCYERHVKDYAALSATPERWGDLEKAVQLMQGTQPNYSAADLKRISVPVTVAQAEGDEFIFPEHAAYLARTIPGAELVGLKGVTHFAPVQRPEVFNAAVLRFLGRV